MKKELFEIRELPVLPLRGMYLFPGMSLHFDVGRKFSLAAVKAVSKTGGEMFFVPQKDADAEDPGFDGLAEIGVVGTVRQILRLPGKEGGVRIMVEGERRGRLLAPTQKTPYLRAQVELLSEDRALASGAGDPALYEDAVMFALRRYFSAFSEHTDDIPYDIVTAVYKAKDLGRLTDLIAGNVVFEDDQKAALLAACNVFARAELLCVILAHETEILILDESVQEKVNGRMDKNQREYYLREELRVITEELGEAETEEADSLLRAVEASAMPEENKEKLRTEIARMRKMSGSNPDAHVLRTYIEKCLEIPWGKYTKENPRLDRAKRVLERDHYGLREVKDRVTEMIAALIVSPHIKGQILCLAGPPGVGKTSVARSIAAATGRNYVRVSLGGVRDEAEIRGHRRTYIGAVPGRVISALTEAKSLNPLILLDEVDKMGADLRGDPAAALLEVLDGEQNFSFRDHYIDMPVDLSRVLFVTTANDKTAIPAALRDRMEVIDIPGYTFEEKVQIAKKHLIPKQLKEHGLTRAQLRITDKGLRALIDGYTREAGVRVLERRIAALCRKESVRLASGEDACLTVTENNLETLLGVKKYRPEELAHKPAVGLVNGLAWTSVGGELLQVEAAVLPGSGKLELTGSLGDVMKESARAAVSYIRSRADAYGIEEEFYKTKDIHIHFPEGAVPKDGPSAGITTTAAVVSALTGRPVRGDVAMTGEITLRGRVLQIGGLREKSMAAYREGIPYVLIPYENEPDLEEVDPAVKAKVTFLPIKTADEALNFSLLPAAQRNGGRIHEPQ